jgi:serine/threonine-protein kinase
MTFAPAMMIGPNLRLERMLARGGMGSVWIAEHLGLRTKVAVKFIDETVAADPSAVLRFSREAEAAAQIKSPHVVQIYDHGLIDDRVPYIVMELLDGTSLGEHLHRCETLGTRATAAILSQVARALSKAHELGIVHRDIKPDNVFLTDSDGEIFVKVLDFGIAKLTDDTALAMTSTGAAMGTPYYMSPEQIVSAKSVSGATDLWALGVVAYECLTGVRPFRADTYGGLCVEISRGVFAPATEMRRDLPRAVDAWFRRALHVDPAERFASARELAEQFQEVVGLSRREVVAAPAMLRAAPAPGRGSSRDEHPSGAATATVHREHASWPSLRAASLGSDVHPEPRSSRRSQWPLWMGAIVLVLAGIVWIMVRSTEAPALATPASLPSPATVPPPVLDMNLAKPAAATTEAARIGGPSSGGNTDPIDAPPRGAPIADKPARIDRRQTLPRAEPPARSNQRASSTSPSSTPSLPPPTRDLLEP